MLLDTASLYFRAYFGVPDSLRAPDGTSVNAVRGLLDFVTRLVTDHRPSHMVACLDADWRPAFRVAAIASYKAHRVAADGTEDVPDALAPQVPVIEQALDALGIARMGVAGYEADDVIGTLATTASTPVDVVTGDRDLFQLIDDARGIRVLYTARGVSRLDIVDGIELEARYGIAGRAYADFALLRGDPSDGLPGVPGVGEKTAAALIRNFGDLEGLLAALDDPASALTKAQRARLQGARDYLKAGRAVVRVVTDVPVRPDLDPRLPRTPRDPAALSALTERWGLGRSVDRLVAALQA
jgi:5'-3' exonuclease